MSIQKHWIISRTACCALILWNLLKLIDWKSPFLLVWCKIAIFLACLIFHKPSDFSISTIFLCVSVNYYYGFKRVFYSPASILLDEKQLIISSLKLHISFSPSRTDISLKFICNTWGHESQKKSSFFATVSHSVSWCIFGLSFSLALSHSMFQQLLTFSHLCILLFP